MTTKLTVAPCLVPEAFFFMSVISAVVRLSRFTVTPQDSSPTPPQKREKRSQMDGALCVCTVAQSVLTWDVRHGGTFQGPSGLFFGLSHPPELGAARPRLRNVLRPFAPGSTEPCWHFIIISRRPSQGFLFWETRHVTCSGACHPLVNPSPPNTVWGLLFATCYGTAVLSEP